MKKITLTAIKKAVKSHYVLNDMKEIDRGDSIITFTRGTTALVTFQIFGCNTNYVGWFIEGYTTYILCDWLNEIVKSLEKGG